MRVTENPLKLPAWKLKSRGSGATFELFCLFLIHLIKRLRLLPDVFDVFWRFSWLKSGSFCTYASKNIYWDQAKQQSWRTAGSALVQPTARSAIDCLSLLSFTIASTFKLEEVNFWIRSFHNIRSQSKTDHASNSISEYFHQLFQRILYKIWSKSYWALKNSTAL